MITRRVRAQVVAFVLIALVGVSYVGARYAGLDTLFGANAYVVKARLADSGGVFTNAEVTYRGVGIGRVGELHLVADGVEVDLRLRDDAPPVPADVDVIVANRSAVGEQYLDLRPRRDGEPYLRDGSVISRDRGTLPLPSETVLLNLDRLVESVPGDELRSVVDELYLATQGTGPGLQALLDASNSFTKAATEHLPQTTALITDAGTVLATQVATGAAIKDFAANTKLIAEQVGRSDGDLRAVLANAPGAAAEISTLLRDTGPTLGVLFADLLTTANVLAPRRAGLEQLLVTTPQAVAAAADVIRPDGAHFALTTTFFDPMPCVTGYEGTRYRNGLDISPAPWNTNARCSLPPGSGNVRGSQNVPSPGVPPATKPGTYFPTQDTPRLRNSLSELLSLDGG
ncbi:MCE family protein [Actinokineospora cianjurensis]|uniref:Phospholipid/cholesterol/gamma-HCH transport system substrate-binding protein n=1 Tax=Actinokineospora cianjurensis TaxID=585224 RepID=A0A421AUS3_9PSEU|nr:MlaD family protein [Actinokineospora cianjurensis]RLK53845.1 phospholipid/cholesterol/gamma-HCH transport system substrate-binding protein [Actinokineospora cianjurensis]